MFRAAVLGSPINHSRSPVLHNAGYRALGLEGEYAAIECTAEQLPNIVGGVDESFVGFSVTMPCKFAALEFANTVSDRARLIGSANTLVRKGDSWWADNTDGDGVLGAMRELGMEKPRSAIMVGAGGTARAVVWALAILGCARVTVLNRSDRSAEYTDLAAALGIEIAFAPLNVDSTMAACVDADCVISTIPAASYEDNPDLLQVLATRPVFDVIYDPWPTPLVQQAQANGQPAVGGHVMLAHQAYAQFLRFTMEEPPCEAMWQALVESLGIDE